MLFTSQFYPKFKNFIIELISPFLSDVLSNNHNLKSEILFWACQMRMEECTTLVNNLLPEYLNNPTSFRPNDRQIVLCNAVKLINQKSTFNEMISLMLSIDGDKLDWISGLSCVEEGYWLTEFLLLAYNDEVNLTTADRRNILIFALENHRYGSMAGIELLARKSLILSDGEILFILNEVVKRFWNRNWLTTFQVLDLDEIAIYVNLARKRLEWFNVNGEEIESWLDSWHETTTSIDSTTTDVMTTSEETTTTGRASFIIIKSPIIVLMIYGTINV
jgi:hypothetical protein